MDLGRPENTALSERLCFGRVVRQDVQFDKFAGRVVARAESADGTDLADLLITGRRPGWCEPAGTG